MKIIYYILLLFTIISCNGKSDAIQKNENKQKNSPDWNTFDDDLFSIQFPSAWEQKNGGPNGIIVGFLSPVETPKDKFKENVNVMVQDLSGQGIDLNEYTEISENQIKSMMSRSKIIESTRIIEEGELPYHKIIYAGRPNEFQLKFEQYYFVKDEKAFVITLTCEEKRFDAFKKIGEKILDSFKLK